MVKNIFVERVRRGERKRNWRNQLVEFWQIVKFVKRHSKRTGVKLIFATKYQLKRLFFLNYLIIEIFIDHL